MPMFEYRCRDCMHVFEKYRSGCCETEERKDACPSCGGSRIEKVFSLFGSSARGGGGSSCGSGGGFRGFS